MVGLRLVARLLGTVAWIVVVASAVVILAVGAQFSRLLGSPLGMLSVVPPLVGLVLASGGLFVGWALLTGLAELYDAVISLHDQGQRMLHTIRTFEFELSTDATRAPTSSEAPVPVRP